MTQTEHHLGEVVRLFLRLGFTAFGGPAAHIAMMHDEVVTRRKWVDQQYFLDLVGATNLVPGPNSTEMVIHLGYHRAGWRGLVLAGVCFVLPASLIVGVLAWAYMNYGSTPQGEALMFGVKPVIIAIVLQALVRLGRTAIKGYLLAAVGVATLVLYLLGVNELVLLFGGALLYWLIVTVRDRDNLAAVAPLLSLSGLTGAVATAIPFRLDHLFWIFFKIGSVLYGSGYVLLAFLRNDLVLRTGWLTDQQLLDAIAIGQFTPGPLFTSATFIGYVLAGVPGAALATLGIFLPSFIFVGLLTRLVPHLRKVAWTARLLDGVNVAAIGLMTGVLIVLGRAALVDIPTVLIAVVSAALLVRVKVNSAWLVLGGGLIGLGLRML